MSIEANKACGCCAGVAVATPAEVQNRPGLSEIRYRVGDYGRFRQTLLARLSAYPELADLTTRDPDDFTLALLDACAAMGDVFTFYQERIANEHYLPTATERRSALEMSRLVGYQLRPGVAASVWLAFTLETATMPGGAAETRLKPGIRVQSIPGPDEAAQSFESVEEIRARPEWNLLRPRLTRYQTFDLDSASLLLEGLTTGLKRGDGLILTTGAEGSALRLVTDVQPDAQRQFTRVSLEPRAQRAGVRPTRRPGGGVIGFERAPVTPGPFERRPLAAAMAFVTAAPAAAVPAASSVGTRAAVVGDAGVAVTAAVGGGAGGAAGGFGGMLNTLVTGSDLYAGALLYNFDVVDLFAHLKASAPPPQGVLALRTRSAIFGHNAPRWGALPVNQRSGEWGPDPSHTGSGDPPWVFVPGTYRNRSGSWVDGNNLASYPDPHNEDPIPVDRIYLDTQYPQLAPESFIAIKDGDRSQVYQIDRVDEVSKSDFTLSAKVSRLVLRFADTSDTGLDEFGIRSSTVFGQSEELALARLPIETPVEGLDLELEGWIEGLYPGQKLIVCGERADLVGVQKCEPAEIDRVEYLTEEEGYTKVTLKSELAYSYRRDSVQIHGNVALATHGEAVSEVLGSGDPSQGWQAFDLKQSPLTYVSSADPADAGARSTLEVRIDGVAWHEVPFLYGRAPGDRVFLTHQDDAGRTSLMFGDGATGARPPGGTSNVEASYRKGIGSGGNVRAGQISLLLSRPLGLNGVSNPLAASGGADAEPLEEARHNLPLSVRTLERVVSLADYADFARAFAGIAKAHAAWIWEGSKRVVALTVAGTDGQAVESGSTLHGNLLAALQRGGDASIPVGLLSYRPGLVRIDARLRIHPDYDAAEVLAEADARLRERLAFDVRLLGESLAASQITRWLQEIAGVEAVDIEALYRALEAVELHPLLFAALPQSSPDGLQAAELLMLDPGGLTLGVMT